MPTSNILSKRKFYAEEPIVRNRSRRSPLPTASSQPLTRTRRLRSTRPVRLGLLATALAAFTAVGPSAYSAPQTPSLPAGGYVSLGDSYASGVGAPPYAKGTDVQVENGNKCKRATAAYAHQVADKTGKTLDFGACAGAWTKHFYEARTPWKEPAQLDHLDASTGLVTFSIGGNDAGFAKILSECTTQLPFSNCSSDKALTDPVDSTIDALAGKGKQTGVYSYDTIMTDIATRAPDATVVAVGYPRMFPRQGGKGGPVPGRCQGLTKVDQRWINARTNELNTALKAAAQRHGYQFTDPSGSFTGHELCGQQSSWFQGLTDDGRFHPNADGHNAMAASVMDTLNTQGQEAAQDQPAAAQAQVDNMRPTGAFTLTRDDDRLSLDASASTDADGAVANIDWYVQHADGTEEILTGARAIATIPANEQVSVTAVITDNQGKEDFTTQTSPAAG